MKFLIAILDVFDPCSPQGDVTVGVSPAKGLPSQGRFLQFFYRQPATTGLPHFNTLGPETADLAAKVVEGDMFGLDTQVIQHLEDGRVHHRGPADVVLDIFRGLVVIQVVVQQTNDYNTKRYISLVNVSKLDQQ